ncbi:glutamyl aminopeptidase-like [Dendronephthya gigantea]|uniref:glutamyl aminopeptidase-like n=1 Tax=Dendronephthya gigantea TaxID=151771 RepID=UPI00106CC0CA|nr:glutamyl aminopeptidase-like [Dendronephthya gigantea]
MGINADSRRQNAKTRIIQIVSALAICCVVAVVMVRNRTVENRDTNKDSGKPWLNIRLPSKVLPIHYDMLIKVNLKDLEFSGKSTISFQVTESTNVILFHINKLRIRNAQVLGKSEKKHLKVRKQFEYKRHQFYVLILVEELDVGEYKLKLNFDGDIETKELNGFYKSTYKTKDGKTRTLALTDFEPSDARKAFPCFDEPAFKSTFTFNIEHGSEYTALSNMNVYSRQKVSDTRTVSKFAKSVRMPTYLIAYMVSDFKHLEATTGKFNNVTIRTWASPEQYQDSAYALGIGKTVTTFYENYYGIPYPLPKQDMIAAPDFNSGGMENWGIIMYHETTLLYKPGLSSAYNKERVTHVVAHELAHMWFGNLVSCLWWNDLWLNEGFASYMEYLGTDHAQPKWKYLDTFLLNDLYRAFRLDAFASSHPITVDVENPADIATIFDGITYSKGASIIRMLSGFLGESVFQKGIKYYLEKHKFGNAEAKDLWNALSEVSGIDIETIMDSWTNQMGFPVVYISRESSGKGKATQKHFLLNSNSQNSKESDQGYSWYVPFDYILEGNTHRKISLWMNRTSASFDWPSKKWLKANVGQRGYYIVNYDKENWVKLSYVLMKNHKILDSTDRTSLINDAFTLARAGNIDYGIAFNLVKYMKKETRYVPWQTLLDNIEYLDKMLRKEDIYHKFKQLILDILDSKIDVIRGGRKLDSKDNPSNIKMRRLILNAACSFGHQKTIENVKVLFKRYLESKSKLDVDLKGAIYAHGIANTGKKEWEKLFVIYRSTTIASERSLLIHGLSMSRNKALLQKFLKYSIDGSKDTVTIINNVANNPFGRNLAWRFLKQNWNIFYERYSKLSFRLASVISSTTSMMNARDEEKEVTDFFKGLEKGSGARAVELSIESINANIKWVERSAPQIRRYLDSVKK